MYTAHTSINIIWLIFQFGFEMLWLLSGKNEMRGLERWPETEEEVDKKNDRDEMQMLRKHKNGGGRWDWKQIDSS